MKKFIAEKYQNITPSCFMEAVRKASKYNDMINLSVGDPDLGTDKLIIDGVYDKLLHGQTHYTNPIGLQELREACIEENKEDYNLELSINNIFIATSATHAMYVSLKAIINPGDEVIAFGPYFSSYKSQVEMCGGVFVEVPTYSEDNFQINPEVLEKYITKKTKALIINTPSNPTGVCYKYQTLVQLSEIVQKYDLLVISDEIYTVFTYEDTFIPFIKIEGMKDRTITIRSCSKDYCMTGFRIGYIIAHQDIINVINNLNEGIVYSAPTPSQWAACYAIKNRKTIQKQIYEEFFKRSKYCYERLLEVPFLKPIKPEGTIYIFVDIRQTKMTSMQFCDWFLENYHILVLPGDQFGKSGEGFVRIATTLGIDKLEEAFNRLK